jgi:hypothetical protein
MKNCPQCNQLNADDARFCSSCGFTAPQVNNAIPPPQTVFKNKRNFKTILIVLGCIIGLCVLGGILGGIKKAVSPTPNVGTVVATPTPTVAPTAQATVATVANKGETKATPAAKDESGVTAANFAKIKTGMKYADVVKILGSEGELLSENEMAGTKTEMYQWKAGILSNMNAMFQNGKLISKAQIGLQ